MLFTTLVLVSVDSEHDGLQQRVDLSHCDKAAEMSNVSGLRLQEEEQVAVLLRFVVVWEEAFLHVGGVFKMAGDFILLGKSQYDITK